MIIIREFKMSDLRDASDLLKETKIEFEKPNENELIYMAFDDEKSIGLAKAKKHIDLWKLEYIYIHEDWRNNKFGDGLLRVVLDKLDREKAKKLYFNGSDEYLIKRGFTKNNDNILEVDIERFFKRKCACSDSDEI